MKILLTIILLSSMLVSKTIDNSLLEIHATIMPKVFLLENNVEKKIKNNTILITIAYEKNSYKDMKLLEDNIYKKYPEGISGYKIKVDFIEYEDFKKCNLDTNIVYLFPSSQKNIIRLIKEYRSCSALTFACHKDYLKNNAMISIDVGKKVKPIVNLNAVKNSNISFKPVLLRISKVFKNEE